LGFLSAQVTFDSSYWITAKMLAKRANSQESHLSQIDARSVDALISDMVEGLTTKRVIAMARTETVELAPDRATTAIASEDGTLYNADCEFIRLLRLEWSDWDGPRLPQKLLEAVTRGGALSFTGAAVSVSATRFGELLLLRASRRDCIQDLAPRELATARLYGSGRSYKEIAKQLGLSPATVRTVVQRVYRKLQVRDKAELAVRVARWYG
jgi:RNA polymerase sigma factor (sigma-70 family)